MLNLELLELIGRPGGYSLTLQEGAERPPSLEEVFSRIARDGWCPRNPAFGSEVDRLDVSQTRGRCLEPLIMEGDLVYVDRNATPEPGDIVSFALSQRAAEAQNADLPTFDARPCKAGDRWLKLFVPYCGIDFLYERYGHSLTATFAACETPDDMPVLHPVRNVRRNGVLLFAPESNATQIGNNAATSVSSMTSGSVSIASGSTLTPIISITSTAVPYTTTLVVTVNGVMNIANGGGSAAPSNSASWAIVDNGTGSQVAGSSQSLYNIPAGLTGQINMVSEVQISIAPNTSKTYSFQANYNSTGSSMSASAVGTVKLEQIKR